MLSSGTAAAYQCGALQLSPPALAPRPYIPSVLSLVSQDSPTWLVYPSIAVGCLSTQPQLAAPQPTQCQQLMLTTPHMHFKVCFEGQLAANREGLSASSSKKISVLCGHTLVGTRTAALFRCSDLLRYGCNRNVSGVLGAPQEGADNTKATRLSHTW